MRGNLLAAVSVFLLVALSNVGNAAAPTPNFICLTSTSLGPDPISSCFASTLPYVAIGLLVSFYVVTLAFLMGEVLNIQSLKGWYKNELWEAVKSVALVIIIFAVIFIAGAFVPTIWPSSVSNNPTGICPPVAGSSSYYPCLSALYNFVEYYYLNPQLEVMNASYNNMIGISTGVSFVKSIKQMVYLPIPILSCSTEACLPLLDWGSINFGADYNWFGSNLLDVDPAKPPSFVKDMLSVLVFPMLAVMAVLDFIVPTLMFIGLGIFLPLGLMLRAVPLLRGIGGTLIAVAIGISLVFPILLMAVNFPISTFIYSTFDSFQLAIQSNFQCFQPGIDSLLCPVISALDPYEGIFYGMPGGPAQLPDGTTILPFTQTNIAFSSGFYAGANAFFNGSIYGVLNSMFFYGGAAISQFILLVVDLIIGIVITGNVARMLGGSLRLRIGSKLKLT